jgi:hypothetical protein
MRAAEKPSVAGEVSNAKIIPSLISDHARDDRALVQRKFEALAFNVVRATAARHDRASSFPSQVLRCGSANPVRISRQRFAAFQGPQRESGLTLTTIFRQLAPSQPWTGSSEQDSLGLVRIIDQAEVVVER